MTQLYLIPIALFYPLMLLSDGCVLIAIALAATLGGSAWMWGATFGLVHALYALLGAVIVSSLDLYSESIGNFLVFLGTLVLLKHFFHHRFHHQPGGDCGCDHHPHNASFTTMLSTAGALSFHAIGMGALIRQAIPNGSLSTTVLALALSAALLGTLVTLAVLLGESQRKTITNYIDKIPGITAAALTSISCLSFHHFIDELVPFSTNLHASFIVIALCIILFVGYIGHTRSLSSGVVNIRLAK